MRQKAVDRLAALRVPRYTSYPTAPHFDSKIGPRAYESWLRTLGRRTALSLYLHVPYCRQLCWYCGCHTKITRRDLPLATYAAALELEIDLVTHCLPGRLPVRHLHWGGGTPSCLGPAQFGRVMATLNERFDFESGAEIAIELDPRELPEAFVEALAHSGATRASLGVQTLDPIVQKAINRVQNFGQLERAVRLLRGAGVERINLDLLYGLPYQNPKSCRETVEAVLALEPQRLAVFGYAHVPHLKKHQRLLPEAAMANGRGRWEQFCAIADALTAAGYRQIGIDHFVRPDDPLFLAYKSGHLRRNFQGYTDDDGEVLVAFGASAIGTLPQGYVQNVAAVDRYLAAMEDGRFATCRGFALSDEDRLRAGIIEGLLCGKPIDLEDQARRYGLDARRIADRLPVLEPLEKDGLVEIDGMRLQIPAEALPFARCVASAFDAYYVPGGNQHARAL